MALTDMEQFPEALAAWDQAIELTEANNALFMKLYRLATLARTSEYEKALTELDPLAVQARTSGEALFNVARVYALAAGTIAADSKLADQDRRRRADEAAQHAVKNLQLARLRGWFDEGAERNDLMNNPEWASLRGRSEFQKLLADIAAQVKP